MSENDTLNFSLCLLFVGDVSEGVESQQTSRGIETIKHRDLEAEMSLQIMSHSHANENLLKFAFPLSVFLLNVCLSKLIKIIFTVKGS